ncbi:MAG: AI-2E family transporter [Gammaproteobacteria bacterium RIFCSPHIGHO2_12_FULL_45_9]|nr:MAG: AI-2E family transporter [Gammaproteobacteria bacterium RIFCSPHIGHO2_12_FULL_45_9]
MWQVLRSWFTRNFSHPEAIAFVLMMVVSGLIIGWFGSILTPVFVSIALAYVLQAAVRGLEHVKCPHMLAVVVVFLVFLGVLIGLLVGLLPAVWRQAFNLVHALPSMLTAAQVWLGVWLKPYAHYFPVDPLQNAVLWLKTQVGQLGPKVVSASLSSIPGLIEAVLYLVLVPLLVFFFLKDGQPIMAWCGRYLPMHRGLLHRVWAELHVSIGAYVRGRLIEMLIVGTACEIAFASLGLPYALLLSAAVAVSVVIPYIGAVVVTIPVVIIGLLEWGATAHLGYLIACYAVIITLDANVLVPLLFSETMKLHPIVIILAVLVFGGLWGFWGVFFAIPLATLVKTLLQEWPQVRKD